MENPKKLKIAVTVLGVALLVSLGMLAWAFRQIHIWRGTVDNLAEQAGGEWALRWFQHDKLELIKMDVGTAMTNGAPIFSGQRDGPFEVWLYPDYTELPLQERYAERKVIETFNSKMRHMYERPQFYKWKDSVTNTTATNDNK